MRGDVDDPNIKTKWKTVNSQGKVEKLLVK